MYQRPLSIQKGVQNTVQLQFKNSDQKRIDISEQAFVMNVFDDLEHTLMLTKDVTILDTGSTSTIALRGIGEVVFTESDTLDLAAKTYKFAIVKAEGGTSYSPTYVNTYYNAGGLLEVKNEIYPVAKPSTKITNFQRTFNSTLQKWEYSTSVMRAYPEFQSKNALHTLSFSMTRFKGDVIIEATMDNSPTPNSYYAKIAQYTYSGLTETKYLNFNGVFSNIQLKYIPEINPITGTNTDTAFSGTFDKVLYRS
jgi:hypothetical protein